MLVHDVSIQLKVLLDGEGGILGAPYYSKIVYVYIRYSKVAHIRGFF